MRSIAIVLLLCLIALPAQAQRTMTVLASPTSFGGEDGHAFRIETPGDDTEEFFFIDNANGLVEFHALRVPPAPFESLGGGQYLVPITVANVPSLPAFAFIEDCGPSQATYQGMVELTVPAGTYMTYQYNIDDSCGGNVIERMYWADGVGLVRQAAYIDGVLDQAWDLNSVTINGGSGLFPRATGNTWEFVAGSVETGDTSMGTLKAKFTE